MFFTDSPIDPVALFQFYTSKLNKKNPFLWQRPKRKVRGDDDEWFDNIPIGPHPLENFMKKLSEKAGLSQIYTNHCIRATVITQLDKAGFEARHIRAVSGHKSDETIKSYSVKCPENKKREMSDALSTAFNKKPKIADKEECAKENLNTINFEDIVDFIPIDNNANDFDIGQLITEFAEQKNRAKYSQKCHDAIG